MKLAYFPGCKISFYLKAYGDSFESVMKHLGVDLVKLEFNCCGYPARGEHFEISVFCAIKNLALAQKNNLDIITPCKCCFGQFKQAVFWYYKHTDLKTKIDGLLEQENLSWDGSTQIHHLISFLYHEIGLDALEKKIVKKFSGKKIAVQYGCHALRPFSVTRFDHPYAPTIFEDLVRVTGMEPVDWSKSTECCGNPILEGHKALSLSILENKFKSASFAGADYICTACTHCQMQYEMPDDEPAVDTHAVKPVLFTHILDAAFGGKIVF